jgi:hypothetical protein
VLIGVELLETLKAYVGKDVIHVRVVLEVALIAMARKVIIEEPNNVLLRAPGETGNRPRDFWSRRQANLRFEVKKQISTKTKRMMT